MTDDNWGRVRKDNFDCWLLILNILKTNQNSSKHKSYKNNIENWQ